MGCKMSIFSKIVKYISYNPFSFVMYVLVVAPLYVILGCVTWGLSMAVLIAVVDGIKHMVSGM